MRWVLRRYSERVLRPQNFCSAIYPPLCCRLSSIWELRLRLSAYRFLAFESREAQITRRDLPPICGVIFFGGIIGPILMFVGLQRLSALTGSLLLNLEGPFTTLIAVGLMREHLGRREMFAAATIMLGGGLVSFQPGHIGGNWIGALEIAGACLSWGIDNNLTQRVSLRDPVAVCRVKTLSAGPWLVLDPFLDSCVQIPLPRTLIFPRVVASCFYVGGILSTVEEVELPRS